MDTTEPHQRRSGVARLSPRAPLESAAPSAAQRARGAVGLMLFTATMGVVVAVTFALVLVVAAVIAITTLG